ncbi:hypothetical protein J2W68_000347 [Luteimonas terrae]|uniref:TonB-dependent receptor n=2 Tax=Luteimonas terrae TaxID=1530191 RepID=A0ABU1XTU2_9GAMM|nr:hypothetical protein [Luteimonas terrae]
MKFVHSSVRRAALCLALGAALSGNIAHAQSNITGIIFGQAEPGTTIVIRNAGTGFSRSVQVDANGRYRATSLPDGVYTVTQQRDGAQVAVRENVAVTIASGTDVSFTERSAMQELDRVEVRGTYIPVTDVSQTDTRSVFTADRLEKMTVGRSIESVALLAPGVVQADSRYPGGASFGGSSASENAFYINGYSVTNPLTNIGSTTLPFDAISQMQVITGGYGAEFGRATGGVVNIVTKRGGNEWEFGGLVSYTPSGLRATYKNIIYPDNGTPSDGLVHTKRDEVTVNSFSYGVSASGPLIKDRLFLYAGGEIVQQEQVGVLARPGNVANGLQTTDFDMPRWTAKLDWQISDDHLLEVTAVSDVEKRSVSYYGLTYDPGEDTYQYGSEKTGGYLYEEGGELYIGKYTGYLTDSLTLTALYGTQKLDDIADPVGYDPSQVYVSDTRSIANPIQRGAYQQLAFSDAYNETEGGRLDLEWDLGSHLLRFGYDRHDSESRQGQVTSGPGYSWRYESCGTGSGGTAIPGGGGALCPGGNGDYVSQYKFANGGTFSVKQWGYYIEDRWQITDNFLLSLGIRNENFENYNADNVVYVAQKDQWAPRLGLSWDVRGDSSLKLFANAGRYHLAMPNNVALRGAAGSLYTNEYFAFTGIDPVTGVPQGLTPLGDGPYSTNREYGQAPDPNSVAAKGLKSHFQDEVAIGFENTIGDKFTYGARYVYRRLQSAIDDMCDYRPAYNWAIANGYSEEGADNLGNALANCRLFNPGEANTFQLDDGTGTLVEVALSKEQLGFPELKRNYQGLDLFLERPFDGTWMARVDYTLSKNYGNAEGQLKSDIGQTDVSQTQDWDHPELMENANGYLPNDRRHYIKASGFYQITPEWRVSATASLASGRPKNCMGYYPDTPENEEFNALYAYGGPYYFYCNNQPTPRGSAGRLPWNKNLDVGVAYRPEFAGSRLEFGVDIFNVFNSQTEQNRIEYGENGGPGVPYNQAGRVVSYTLPRYARFSIRWDL